MKFLDYLFHGKELKAIGNYFKMLNGYSPTFTSFSGGVYEMDLTRTAINNFATHCSKLKPEIEGSALKSLEKTLQHKPNYFMDTTKFIKRLATYVAVEHTAFIIPIEDEYGRLCGWYPLRAERCEVVESEGQLYLRYLFANGSYGAIEFERVGIMTDFEYKDDLFGEDNSTLAPTMQLIHTQNEGIINAVKNSANIRFLAKVANMLKPEDIKKERKRFTEDNLSADNDSGMIIYDNKFSELKQVESKPYTPNALQMQHIQENVCTHFGTNMDILQNKFDENTWNAYYEGKIEPFAIQLSLVMTNMSFTERERACGNAIFFSANRLQYASNATKLSVSTQLFDRALLNRNGVMDIWNMAHVEDGEKYYIRKEYTEVSELNKGSEQPVIIQQVQQQTEPAAGEEPQNGQEEKEGVNNASYFVGFNGEVWQCVEDANIAWHCGASSYKHAECRNANSIGIEMCVRKKNTKSMGATDKDWYFEDATVEAAAELTRYLMNKYGVPASHVIRHYDVTGKICPNPYVYNTSAHTWDEFKRKISGQAETPQGGNEKTIWNFLTGKGLNAYAVAGIMGNLYAESGLMPNNLQNAYNNKLGKTDAEYTAAVDNGSYGNFVKDSAGYGLAQWTYWSRKQALLNHAKQAGVSIADLNMQLGFLWEELQGYTAVMDTLKKAGSVRAASDAVLTGYEKPADQSETAKKKRAEYGEGYYKKYAAGNGTKYYRVRKSWTDAASQLGAFTSLENAKSACKAGYTVYDDNGKAVYTAAGQQASAGVPFSVQVDILDLNIRTGAGTNYAKTGETTGKGVFTIVEVKAGQGASAGWGRLKSGAGWISLDYATRLA